MELHLHGTVTSLIHYLCINHLSSSLPNVWYPNCLQTTSASLLSHRLSQIVPQNPSAQTSTVPIVSLAPNRRWVLPSEQFIGAKTLHAKKVDHRNWSVQYLDIELQHPVSDHMNELQHLKMNSWSAKILYHHSWPGQGIFHHFLGHSRK